MGIVEIGRKKSFKFLWKSKKNKIKRSGLYLDLDNGGIRMTDFDVILKALKLNWIPGLLWISDNSDWCIIPKHSFRSKGGLNFLLRWNYDTNYFNDIPFTCKKILEFFNELKTLYSYNQKQELILFNNKDILVNYSGLVSRRTMNVYTTEIEIQLGTLLSNVCLPECLPKRSWTGSTKWMRAKSPLPQRRPCSVLLQVPTTQQ